MDIISFCAGIIVGVIAAALWLAARFIGTMRIHTDEEGQVYPFAEIHKGKSHLIFGKDRFVIFKTNHKNYGSQE